MITNSNLSNEKQNAFEDLVDDICKLLQSGLDVDLERIVTLHPDVAEQIRSVFPALVAINSLANPSSRDSSSGEYFGNDKNQSLGDFQILRQIGRGGMGVVYEAQQLSINRKVALKILPLASLVDSRALQRFKNEVSAIATLEHPHIVSVYSIGEDRGIHYFAMQLIRGQSLAAVIRELQARADQEGSVTGASLNQVVSDLELEQQTREKTGADQFGAQHPHLHSGQSVATPFSNSPSKLDGLDETAAIETQARGRSTTKAAKITDPAYFRNVVRLIKQAAEALQHAHDHGIVHRDVKPGNLLLDTHGTLFVTDFGLARIETAVGVTMTGDMLGTLRYMSPEQVQANRMIVDHRTDVYSLGATLYELLTLRPIWEGNDKAELIRQISIEEPVRPQKINPSIPIDLETIVLKAINKNPNDRYDSTAALGEDLQRFLDQKPIIAKRPTTAQRINKWTRRNPAIMWSVVILMFITTIASAVSTILILNEKNRADRQTRLLMKARDEALAQKDRADLESSVAKAFKEYVNSDLMQNADPNAEPNRDLKVSDIVDRALISIGNRFQEQPLVEAEIRTMLGRTLGSLARYNESQQQLLLVKKIYDQHSRSDSREALEICVDLGWRSADQGRYQDSLDEFDELHLRCQLLLGPLDVITLKTEHGAACALRRLGRYEDAETQLLALIAKRAEALGPTHFDTMLSKRDLATVVYLQGKYSIAEQLYRESLDLQKTLIRDDHPARLSTLNGLADAIADQGRADEAESYYRELLDIQERVMGKEHPQTLNTMNGLAAAIGDQGKHADAEKLLRIVVDIRKRVLGDDHPDTLINKNNLGNQIWSQGRFDEAEKVFFDVAECYKRLLGPDHPSTQRSLNNLATTISDQYRFDEAEKLYREVAAARTRVLGKEHPDTLTTINNLAVAIAAQGRHDEAEELYRQVLEGRRRLLGPKHPHTLITLGTLATTIHKQGRHEEAEVLFRQVLDARQRVLGPEHPHTLIAKRWLGISLLDQGRSLESEQILRGVLEAQERVLGPEHPEGFITTQKLADSIAGQGRFDEAERLHRQTVQNQNRVLSESNPALLAAKVGLANDLLQLDRLQESETIARQVIDQIRNTSSADNQLLTKVATVLESSLNGQGRADEAIQIIHELLPNKQKE